MQLRHILTVAAIVALFAAPFLFERDDPAPEPKPRPRPERVQAPEPVAKKKPVARNEIAKDAPAQSPLRALANYWAPAIENDTSRPDYRNDFLAAVNFDGDWDVSNNWDNRNDFPLWAVAYWWGTETRTHAFLGYAFYRVASGAEVDAPNEMQGVVVVVRRNAGPQAPNTFDPGRFEALLVWSHGRFDIYTEQDREPDDPDLAETWGMHLRPAGEIRRADRTVAGDIEFMVDRFGVHPLLYTDEDEHRMSPAPGQRSGGPGLFGSPLTDWRDKDYAQRKASAGDAWGNMRGVPQDGIMYVFANQSVLPVVDTSGKGRGRYKHHWELVGYDLVGLETLWARRTDANVFVDGEEFATSGRQRTLHLAPWAWTEDASGLKGLDPVRNPLALVEALVGLPKPYDTTTTARSFETEDPS